MKPELGKAVSNLAYAEVIDYNKSNLDRELYNEFHNRDRGIDRGTEREIHKPMKKHKTIDEPLL